MIPMETIARARVLVTVFGGAGSRAQVCTHDGGVADKAVAQITHNRPGLPGAFKIVALAFFTVNLFYTVFLYGRPSGAQGAWQPKTAASGPGSAAEARPGPRAAGGAAAAAGRDRLETLSRRALNGLPGVVRVAKLLVRLPWIILSSLHTLG